MNQNNVNDNPLEIIENFFILTSSPNNFNIIRDLILILENEFETDIDIISELNEIILSQEDEELINFEISKLLFNISEEILSSYGIIVNKGEITLKLILDILNIILEVPKYNLLTYQEVVSILLSEQDDNIIKLNNLLTYKYNTPSFILYDFIESVSDNFINNLINKLETDKETYNEVDEDYIEFKNKILNLYPPLLNTNLVKVMTEKGEYEIELEDMVKMVYNHIEINLKFNIEKSALEILGLLLLSNNIENVYYTLDGTIIDDLNELGYDNNIITSIIDKVRELLMEVRYD